MIPTLALTIIRMVEYKSPCLSPVACRACLSRKARVGRGHPNSRIHLHYWDLSRPRHRRPARRQGKKGHRSAMEGSLCFTLLLLVANLVACEKACALSAFVPPWCFGLCAGAILDGREGGRDHCGIILGEALLRDFGVGCCCCCGFWMVRCWGGEVRPPPPPPRVFGRTLW